LSKYLKKGKEVKTFAAIILLFVSAYTFAEPLTDGSRIEPDNFKAVLLFDIRQDNRGLAQNMILQQKIIERLKSSLAEYKLDANGNKVTDSLGNAVKVTKYKTISCKVYETRQFKQAHIDGSINYVDGQSRQIILSVPIAADHSFEHYYSKAEGNFDALSNETRAKLKAKPAPYPYDIDMIYNANATLKNVIYAALMDKKTFITNRY